MGRELIDRIGGVDIYEAEDRIDAFVFESGMRIDADGSPRAYHPESAKGLDDLRNAGRPGRWWGVVTDTGEPDGEPVVQGDSDPAPGFYVSATALSDWKRGNKDPRKYVDAEVVPYIVLPSRGDQGAHRGDLAWVLNRNNGQQSGAVYADVGPSEKIGEGSIALAKRLGVNSDARRGGCASGIVTLVFRRSRVRWPMELDEIEEEARRRFEDWGGLARLRGMGMWE